MSWATRATLILGILWALLTSPLIILFVQERPGPMLIHFGIFEGIPIGATWLVLRLILGNRGSVRYH